MSQIYKSTGGGGSLPPYVATSYVENSGTAVPALNILDILANFNNTNNDNGIYTTGATNVVTVLLSNRLQAKVTTNNNTLTTILTFALPSVGVYTFDLNMAAYDINDALGSATSLFFGVISDGTTATVLDTADLIINAQVGMQSAIPSIAVSGNSLLVQVTGLSGKTIDWSCVGTYVLAT